MSALFQSKKGDQEGKKGDFFFSNSKCLCIEREVGYYMSRVSSFLATEVQRKRLGKVNLNIHYWKHLVELSHGKGLDQI